MKWNVLKVLAMCKSVTNVQSGGGNSLSIKHEHKKMLKINHFAKVIGMFIKVQNLHFEIKFHETKSFFQSIWLFFGSLKQIDIMRHPGSENGEKMLLLMGLVEEKRLLATFTPNPWQLQLH